jgi:hypothetical protein
MECVVRHAMKHKSCLISRTFFQLTNIIFLSQQISEQYFRPWLFSQANRVPVDREKWLLVQQRETYCIYITQRTTKYDVEPQISTLEQSKNERPSARMFRRDVVSKRRPYTLHPAQHQRPRPSQDLRPHAHMGNPHGPKVAPLYQRQAATAGRYPPTTSRVVQHPNLLLKHPDETFATYA